MARSLNRVQLIGNLTRDPELRYTPNGNAVCTFGIATNRTWTTDSGEKREEVDFHRIVAWNKLAELCSQFLVKGRKVYVEGRLSTRNWTGQDGTQKSTTEVVIDDMILLDNKQGTGAGAPAGGQRSADSSGEPREEFEDPSAAHGAPAKPKPAVRKKEEEVEAVAPQSSKSDEEVAPDDIPF
jgi:single-strand DNA-binding protein